MENVVVTGVGVTCCLGSGVDALWSGMTVADGLPRPVGDPHARFPVRHYYLVDDTDVPPAPASVGGLRLGRASRLGVATARQAVADAGLTVARRSGAAVLVATAMGDSGLHEDRRADPVERPYASVYQASAAIAADLGTTGPATVVGNACAGSGYALALAADLIRAGEADVVLAGGTEAYTRVALAAFNRMGAADPDRCRPFEKDRRGTVFGEGAAVLVLESERHARARSAPIRARLIGAGLSCDGHHITAPDPDGEQIRRAMLAALAEGGATPADVGAVVPHGTGTELNDVVESQVLTGLLADRVSTVPLFSLKALVGHTGGAAAGLAAVAATLILDRGKVPANRPLARQDERCAVWLPQSGPADLAGDTALVNAYGFGGNNVSLLFERVAA